MRLVPLVLALALMSSGLGAAEVGDDAPPPQSEDFPMTLADIDRALEALRNTPWSLPEMLGNPTPRMDGTTLDADIARYLATEPLLKELEELRRELPSAIPQGSDLVPVSALAPLRRMMSAEGCRYLGLMSMWSAMPSFDTHLQLIAAQFGRLPPPSQAEWRTRFSEINTRAAAFHGVLPAVMDECKAGIPDGVPAWVQDIDVFIDDANRLRAELAAATEALPVDAVAEPVWMMRPRPCPESSGETTGREQPRVIRSVDPTDFYPADAVRNSVEGRVRIFVEADSTGCVTRSAVAQSSGAPELDRAGMQMAFELQLMPGEVDGKAVGGRFTQPITFEVRNGPRPPAGAAQPQP